MTLVRHVHFPHIARTLTSSMSHRLAMLRREGGRRRIVVVPGMDTRTKITHRTFAPRVSEQTETRMSSVSPSDGFKEQLEFSPMLTAYIVVTLLAIAVNTFSATVDFVRYRLVLINMAKVGVPESWLTMLGTLKAAGAAGLVLGLIGVPLIGEAAAIGLILFFVGAIITHLRARDYSLGYPATYLLLAVGTLVLGVVS
jgi:hypothetical protein